MIWRLKLFNCPFDGVAHVQCAHCLCLCLWLLTRSLDGFDVYFFVVCCCFGVFRVFISHNDNHMFAVVAASARVLVGRHGLPLCTFIYSYMNVHCTYRPYAGRMLCVNVQFSSIYTVSVWQWFACITNMFMFTLHLFCVQSAKCQYKFVPNDNRRRSMRVAAIDGVYTPYGSCTLSPSEPQFDMECQCMHFKLCFSPFSTFTALLLRCLCLVTVNRWPCNRITFVACN